MPAQAIAGNEHFSMSDISDCWRTPLEIEDARHDPFFGRVTAVWDAKRGTRDAPFRRDIDALDFSSDILPRLMLIEVIRNPLRFRFRLTGTLADQIHERNITGLYTDELRPSLLADTMRQDFTAITETGRPQWVELLFTNAQGHRRQTRILRLPLLANDSTVDAPEIGYIMSVFSFKRVDGN